MFLNLIINAIIWVIICKMSFICAKFTTIAQYEWFQDAVLKLDELLEYKMKLPKLANWVYNASYSKAFSCRPCHCFWLSWIALYFALQIESSIYALIFAFVSAIIIYFMAKGLEPKNSVKIDNETLKNEPWINSRSQYGNYKNDLCLKTKPKSNF